MEEIQVTKNGKFQIPIYYNCKTFSENGDENVFVYSHNGCLTIKR